jgi:lysophospholipase L1-like esterase
VDGKVNAANQPDGAHLSEKGYAIYAGAIAQLVRNLLKETHD